MITIVGCGPSGAVTGYELSRQGKDVTILEEHEKVGLPEACTGLFSYKVKDELKLPKKLILNQIKAAKIYSPNGKHVKIKLKEPDVLVSRKGLDEHLANKAVDSGVKLLLGKKFVNYSKRRVEYSSKTGIANKLKSEILIGADGPRSQVARNVGIQNKRKFLVGLQGIIKKKTVDPCIKFYPHVGEYAWEVPINDEYVKLGVASSVGSKQLYADMLKKCKGKEVELQAGPIPLFNSKHKVTKQNIFLVGDAAGQIKNTTGGGILAGIKAGRILSDCVVKNKNYNFEYNRKLKPELFMHSYVNKILGKFSDKNWNNLISSCNNSGAKESLSLSRDELLTWAFKMIIKQPKLLSYSGKAITSLGEELFKN